MCAHILFFIYLMKLILADEYWINIASCIEVII